MTFSKQLFAVLCAALILVTAPQSALSQGRGGGAPRYAPRPAGAGATCRRHPAADGR